MFREQVGLAPKAVARILRFEGLCRRLGADPARWADIASECGYHDQAHLNGDFRQLPVPRQQTFWSVGSPVAAWSETSSHFSKTGALRARSFPLQALNRGESR